MIGRNVEVLMQLMGWTQRELGEQVGASQSTVCGWISGVRPIRDEHRDRLARVFSLRRETLEDDELVERVLDYLTTP
jgi:transcriptional regulator with XRE-family HTH domain